MANLHPWENATPVSTRIGTALVVTLPRELDDAVLAAIRREILPRVQHAGLTALIFEAAGLDVIDQEEFGQLSGIARSASWLGVRPMVVGLAAGVVSYLVIHGVDTSAFEPFGQLEDALGALA